MLVKEKCEKCKKPMMVGMDKDGNKRDKPFLCSRKKCKGK